MGEVKIKSGNLFDIGTNVNDYERPASMVSVSPSSVAMKLESGGNTVHYRLQNITTTGAVTIYCKGSIRMPRLYLRLRSADDTRWLTKSDVSISGMVYNPYYNGWFNDVSSNIFIKTIVIPDCLYWNLGLGFNSISGTVGDTVSIINPIVVEGTYTSETIPPYQPYFLTLPSHQKTADGWKDIPTHIMTATGWQGELTSQSPLEFRATGQSLLDWRIEGASGGVGDWDETEQKYKIPVTVNGTTTNLFTDHQLMDGDSIDYTTTETQIPIATGNNVLTVDTAVQPKSVFVKFEG